MNRFFYSKAYQREASARGPWFGLQTLCVFASLIVGLTAGGKILKKEFSRK